MPFPWFAGMRVTADRLNEHNPIYAFKGEFEDRSNTTTPAPDDDLSLTLPDGIWEFQVFIDYGSASGPGGIRTNYAISGLSTISIRRCMGPDAASTNRNETMMRSSVHGSGTQVQYGSADGTGLRAHAMEEFIMQGSGTITLQWAQRVSHANPTRLAANSFIRAVRIG